MTALSVVSPWMPVMSWHPWRAIRNLDVTVLWERRDDLLGSWDDDTRTMTFHPDQSQRQRRCTATHELVHAELGHRGHCAGKAELRVRKEAARRLISIYALGEALAFHGEDDVEALADELWVDPDTLATRLTWLHPAERGYLRRRLERREMGAYALTCEKGESAGQSACSGTAHRAHAAYDTPWPRPLRARGGPQDDRLMSSVGRPSYSLVVTDRQEYYRRLRELAPAMVGSLGDTELEVLRFLLRPRRTPPEDFRDQWRIRQHERATRAIREARRIPAALREEVFAASDWRCVYCGDWADAIDHIVPVARGGTRRRRNLAAACTKCNAEKLSSTPEEWRAWREREGYGWPPEGRSAMLLRLITQRLDAEPSAPAAVSPSGSDPAIP